jgi:hypothetical protein
VTTRTFITRDERARAALEAAVLDFLRSPPPKRISVTARDNHTGDPAFYVFVEMPSEADIPDVPARRPLKAAMAAALEKIDDGRFPYLHFGPREETGGDDEVVSGIDEDFP